MVIGVIALIVAPTAQSCVSALTPRVCETGGTIVLNIVGGLLIVTGGSWLVCS